MILVLHPEQVRQVLDLAADLDLDPTEVTEIMYGPVRAPSRPVLSSTLPTDPAGSYPVPTRTDTAA